ncbi:urea transporter [Paraburkholderia antibiotica]|uniref:Urea transporter n=1 Tax=Paraburkholderia antibiotica TaxID=2728839 RepID=A0A7Y0A083_9BURK|nr:urea transporter [Paraburkholderia antibiotica]NML34108.1 urea transporter [Paraburkholderia antibiotica]
MHAAATDALAASPSAPLRMLLRSFGQIVLQANAFSGACFVAAWLLSGPRLACAALLGALAANVNATLAGAADADTRAGLHGFNGALAGLAAFSFIDDPATAAAVALLAATATAWLQPPWSRWLRKHGLGCYSSPCLIVTWLWLPLAGVHAGQASALPAQPLDAMQFIGGTLAGIAQTGFASGAPAGAIVLLGIVVAARRPAWCALIGGTLASAVLLSLGAGIDSFAAGLCGFNGALTALALADAGWATMLAGVTLAAALQAGAAHVGWPTMSAPFVLATWAMQLIRRRLSCGPRHGRQAGIIQVRVVDDHVASRHVASLLSSALCGSISGRLAHTARKAWE